MDGMPCNAGMAPKDATRSPTLSRALEVVLKRGRCAADTRSGQSVNDGLQGVRLGPCYTSTAV